jgi:Phage integrase, N-terminal SAM-like domain
MQNEPGTAPEMPEGKTVRRKRFQRGCVRKVKHGRRWVWIGKYRENGEGRTKVLGHCADLTEGGAWAKLQEYLQPLNEQAGRRQGLPTNFRVYVTNVYLPQRRKKWKDSTDQTTTERIQTHLLKAFEGFELMDLSRDRLQKFLDQKARSLSRSVVSHLRWDLNAIFKMAAEDAIIEGNPAGSLVTPKEAKTRPKRVMTKEQVWLALSVFDLRERVIFLLAVLAGMRPGEILALRWGKVDPQMIEMIRR